MEYQLVICPPLKPGPKLGSSQRPLKRPRRFKEEANDQLIDDDAYHNVQQDNATEHQRNSSWDQGLLSGPSAQWQPQPDLEMKGWMKQLMPSRLTTIIINLQEAHAPPLLPAVTRRRLTSRHFLSLYNVLMSQLSKPLQARMIAKRLLRQCMGTRSFPRVPKRQCTPKYVIHFKFRWRRLPICMYLLDERLRSPPQDGPHPWMRPGPLRRTQSAYTIPQDLVIRRDSDPHDPRGDGHARHSMSVMKDSPTPVQPFIGLLQQQQRDQAASFAGDTALQWPNRFDDSAIDSGAFVGISGGQLDSFDCRLADNLDFSLANVLNWHSIE